MFALIASYSDGCTYTDDVTIAVFDDEDVAKLAAEELERVAKADKTGRRDFPDLQYGGFHVSPVATFRATSEARVRGIVEELLKSHFPI
jgi:hypothetical protein